MVQARVKTTHKLDLLVADSVARKMPSTTLGVGEHPGDGVSIVGNRFLRRLPHRNELPGFARGVVQLAGTRQSLDPGRCGQLAFQGAPRIRVARFARPRSLGHCQQNIQQVRRAIQRTSANVPAQQAPDQCTGIPGPGVRMGQGQQVLYSEKARSGKRRRKISNQKPPQLFSVPGDERSTLQRLDDMCPPVGQRRSRFHLFRIGSARVSQPLRHFPPNPEQRVQRPGARPRIFHQNHGQFRNFRRARVGGTRGFERYQAERSLSLDKTRKARQVAVRRQRLEGRRTRSGSGAGVGVRRRSRP